MTPAQLTRHFKGVAGHRRYEAKRDIALAFHVASFSRAKKVPPLDSMLRKLDGPGERRKMDWREMARNAKAWTTLLGAAANQKGATQ